MITRIPDDTLTDLEVHCLNNHPIDPEDGLRLINEIRLAYWRLEQANKPGKTEAVKSHYSTSIPLPQTFLDGELFNG
jgi:hypothetical protein